VTTQDYASEDEGFIRLTTDEVKDNLVDAIARVMVKGERIVLQQAGEINYRYSCCYSSSTQV